MASIRPATLDIEPLGTGASTKDNFSPMGLYQLAEVGRGMHSIVFGGYGSAFDLRYMTSQVTTIPVDNVQYTKVTGHWEMLTPTNSSGAVAELLTAAFVNTSDSILVIAATLTHNQLCPSNVKQYQFLVDDKPLFPSPADPDLDSENWQFGDWYSQTHIPGNPVPASMLVFARVTAGEHSVTLQLSSEAVSESSEGDSCCDLKTTGAVLQVGVVPEVY